MEGEAPDPSLEEDVTRVIGRGRRSKGAGVFVGLGWEVFGMDKTQDASGRLGRPKCPRHTQASRLVELPTEACSPSNGSYALGGCPCTQ